MIQLEIDKKCGELIERIAHKVANEKCSEHFQFIERRPHLERVDAVDERDPNDIDPRYWDMFSASNEIVCDLILKKGYRLEGAVLTQARKRIKGYVAYKYATVNKTKHFVKKETKASLATGEVDPERPRDHYLHRQDMPESYADVNGDSRAYEFFESRRHRHAEREEHLYDLVDPCMYSICRNDFEREIVHLLATTCLTRKQMAKQLGIGKTKLQDIIRDIKSRDPMNKRKPRTADPKILNKVQPLAHDNCSPQSGCPVTRMKAFCCETAIDRLIVDLYRDGISIEQIAEQTNQQADWVKTRLGIIAHRYLEM